MKLKFGIRLFAISFCTSIQLMAQEHSVAMQWNEVQLNSIRKDFARPTIQARNLCHASIVMWDAWAIYDECASTFLLGKSWGNYSSNFNGIPIPDDIESARKKCISYAMYRFLSDRYKSGLSPAANITTIEGYRNAKMAELGYDVAITSTNYSDGDPAKLGNYIAAQMQAYALQDGSNQQNNYANIYYTPVNGQLEPAYSGNPNQTDPNRWQTLVLTECLDQNNIPVECPPGTGIAALSPEFGNVNPFAMTDEDMVVYERDGHFWNVYHDQGAPPLLDQSSSDGLESFFKWGYVCNIIWHSFHDISDGVFMDISPAATGNITAYPELGNLEEFKEFYDMYNGGELGDGYGVNPATGFPYENQVVKRGDFTRVLSEFWADGPSSETPPGHWFTIINEKVTNNDAFERRWMGEGEILEKLEWDVRSYLALGGGIMDAAIACWGAKGYYDYTRPIMAIRYMADRGQCSDNLLPNYSPEGLPLIDGFIELVGEDDPLVGLENENLDKIKIYSWTGPANETGSTGAGWLLAENWWTYQKNTFVTPPFPGYMSGHSTYSRTSAEILGAITGSEFFPGGLAEFVAPAFTYLGADVGPSETIKLQWAKYKDASDQCSLSRIYGGLHPPQDDIPGRLMGMIIGPDAVEKANEYISASVPHPSSIAVSDNFITDADAGNLFTVSFQFTKPMNTTLNPNITFADDNPVGSTLIQTSAAWTNETTYLITYNVMDVNTLVDHIVWKISDALGINGNSSVPALSPVVTVDTMNPLVAAILGGSIINDSVAQTGIAFAQVNFNKPMNTTNNPVVSFPNEDPSGSLEYNSETSFWQNPMIFMAAFNVTDNNIEISNMDLAVAGGTDLAGNTQVPSSNPDELDVDTKNPIIHTTLFSDELISDSDSDAEFAIALVFDAPMSGLEFPVFGYVNDNPLNTLESTIFFWANDSTFAAYLHISDVNDALSNIDMDITSARDMAGNSQHPLQIQQAFEIDMMAPTINSLSTNSSILSDLNLGNEGLIITLVCNDEVNTDVQPAISFLQEDEIQNTFTFMPGASGWINNTTYEAAYEVDDIGIEVLNIDIEVSEIEDNAGNTQQTVFAAFDALSIDTRNPDILFVTANTYDVTGEFIGNSGFSISAVFDEEMDTGSSPQIDFPLEDPSSILLLNSNSTQWLNTTNYQLVYDVDANLINVSDIDIELSEARDVAGNINAPLTLQDFFTVHEIVGVGEFEDNVSVKVFPNPIQAGSDLNIYFSELHTGITIDLYSITGKLLFRANDAFPNSTHIKIPVSNVAAGSYVLKLSSNRGLKVLNINVLN